MASNEDLLDECTIGYMEKVKVELFLGASPPVRKINSNYMYGLRAQSIARKFNNRITFDTGLVLTPPEGYLIVIIPNSYLERFGIHMIPMIPIENKTRCLISMTVENIMPDFTTTLAYFYIVRVDKFEIVC